MKYIFCVILFLSASLTKAQVTWMSFTSGRYAEDIEVTDTSIWVATGGGIVSINKETRSNTYYTKFNSNIKDEWNSHYFTNLEVDKSGNLWVGTYYNGIISYDNGNWTYFDHTNSPLPDYEVRYILADADTLWICTYGGGLIKKIENNWTVFNSSNSGLTDDYIIDIDIDSNGVKWVLTDDGLFKYDNNTFTDPSIPSPDICLEIDKNGIFWGASSIGLFKYEYIIDTWQSTQYTPSNSDLPSWSVTEIHIDSLNNKWVGTENGFAIFDETGWVIFDESNSNLHYNYVDKIITDKSSTWVLALQVQEFTFSDSSLTDINTSMIPLSVDHLFTSVDEDSNNLYYDIYNYNEIGVFDGERFNVIEKSDFQSVTCLHVDLYGKLWVGSQANGISYWHDSTWTDFNTGIFNNVYIHSIVMDEDSILWAVSNDLYKFDGSTWTNYSIPDLSAITSNLIIDTSNNVWVGGFEGIAKFDGSSWTSYNFVGSFSADDIIHVIELDKNGTIWAGSEGGGLGEFTGSGWNTYTTSNSNLPADKVDALEVDKDNNLWIGTASSYLTKFDGTNWDLYSAPDIPLYVAAAHIYIDKGENMWIADVTNAMHIYNENGIDLNIILDSPPILDLPKKPELNIPIINIFPNPTSDKVTFSIDGNNSYHLLLFNKSGKNVYKNTKASGDITVDMSIFSTGTYFFQLIDQKNNITFGGKVIKE